MAVFTTTCTFRMWGGLPTCYLSVNSHQKLVQNTLNIVWQRAGNSWIPLFLYKYIRFFIYLITDTVACPSRECQLDSSRKTNFSASDLFGWAVSSRHVDFDESCGVVPFPPPRNPTLDYTPVRGGWGEGRRAEGVVEMECSLKCLTCYMDTLPSSGEWSASLEWSKRVSHRLVMHQNM